MTSTLASIIGAGYPSRYTTGRTRLGAATRGSRLAGEAIARPPRALDRWVVGNAGGQDRADGENGRQREQAAVGRAGGVLHQPDEIGPHEPAEVPDRVDEGDARGRGGPAEQRGGHGPEDGMRAEQEEETDGERRDRRDRRDDGGEREGHGGDGRRDRHVELALAGAIRVA
jgi:hypothetical protein